jgi:hypothetical protein
MRMILAAAFLAALAFPASAEKDNPRGPQWHFMDTSADMNLPIRPWCVPNHPAMGDMLTRGRGSACWTEDGLEEAILAAGSRASLVFPWSRKSPGYHERPGRVYEHHQNRSRQ